MKRQLRQSRHKRWYTLGLTGGLILFVLTTLIALRGDLSVLETRVFSYIYDLPAVLRPLVLGVTQFGGGWAIVFVVIIAYTHRQKDLALRLLLAGLSTYSVVVAAKTLINRPRPAYFLPEVVQHDIFATGLGFPSGHTAVATALSITLLPHLPHKCRFVVPVWILAVGFSRVYLGVHAPLDVIGGSGLGLAIACGLHLALPKDK